MSWLTHTSVSYSIMVALLFAVAAGLVGSFGLMKRMLLAGDVISHLALPGFGLAFLLKINPLLGAATTLFLGTLLIWELQKKTGLATESVIGVVFAAALGIGAAITPSDELVDALFGKNHATSLFGFLLGVLAVVFIIAVIWKLRDQLVLAIFSPELATATGVNVNRVNLWYLLLFSLTILVGLRFMGALLAGSLIILPAAIGRRLTDKMSHFLIASSLASTISVGIGLLLNAAVPKFGPGPSIVMVAALMFAICLLRRP
ncbi:MAG: metal ABC transporter permease [Candidatus Sulfotelmatobacter sp.]